MRQVILFVIIGLIAASSSVSTYQWPEEHRDREILVRTIKTFNEENLGFVSTDSYVEFAEEGGTHTICYTAPLFEIVIPIPTRLRADACPKYDTNEFDGFSRTIKAYAYRNSDSSMNPDLAEEDLDRFIELIIHEEFHEQTWGFRMRGRTLFEGIATLVGLAGAQEFACSNYGKTSDTCASTSQELLGYIEFSVLVNSLAADLRPLYERITDGEISSEDGIIAKSAAFQIFNDSWSATRGNYGKSDEWSGFYSNAGFSEYLVYTTYVPMLYELYLAFDEDVGETSKYLIALSSSVRGLEEEDVVLIIQEKIQELQEGP